MNTLLETLQDSVKQRCILARKNWDAINEVISSAKEGMAFLQTLCGLMADQNEHMHWFTPVQFPAAQWYPRRNTRR